MNPEKFEEIELSIHEAKKETEKVIENVINRGDKIEDLNKKSEKLENEASLFSKNAKFLRSQICRDLIKQRGFLIFILFLIFIMFIGIVIGLIS